MPSPNLGERVAATFVYIASDIADNATNNIAITKKLKAKGKTRKITGGRELEEKIIYRGNETYTRFKGWDSLNINPAPAIDRATYSPNGASVTVSMAWTELKENAGDAEIIDLVTSRLMSKDIDFTNNFEIDLFSAGTLSRQIVGLQGLVSTVPSVGVVGGINAANFPFWRNVAFSGITDGGSAVSATNIESYIDNILKRIVRNQDKPNLILTDNNFFGFLQDSKRARGQLGFQDKEIDTFSLWHNGVEITFAGGIGGACPANRMYFLNTNYLSLGSYTGDSLESLGKRQSSNQAAHTEIYGWYGGMMCSNRQMQAVLTA
jgi:hypothetical protein